MPGKTTRFRFFMDLATEKRTLKRAIRVALLVGVILNLINQPGIFVSFSFHEASIAKIFLTFIVPFGVSLYSSILSGSKVKPGRVSRLDAILKCKRCKKTNFHVHLGEPVGECPECREKTRWSPAQIFSFARTDQELLKSLALFARYNPQPLFRINREGVILGANPESEKLLNQQNLAGQKIQAFIPEVEQVNLSELAQNGYKKEFVVLLSGHDYNFVLQGVPVLNSIHVYGNNITEIIRAEKKIKQQAEEIQGYNY
jgi:PAS domain-containing protein